MTGLHTIKKFFITAKADLTLRQLLAEHQLIMGFGHRVYKQGDPRSPIITPKVRFVTQLIPDPSQYDSYAKKRMPAGTKIFIFELFPSTSITSVCFARWMTSLLVWEG